MTVEQGYQQHVTAVRLRAARMLRVLILALRFEDAQAVALRAGLERRDWRHLYRGDQLSGLHNETIWYLDEVVGTALWRDVVSRVSTNTHTLMPAGRFDRNKRLEQIRKYAKE